MEAIAHIYNDFDTKFGVPRQSGIITHIRGRIVFNKEYRVKEAFRGLEDFSHIWLIWDFSEAHRDTWSPTVRPPRLGGNKRIGVFATRSPFRPNNIGLSSVRLISVDYEATDGPVLIVEGADLMNNTPIYDIKPYLPYTDAHTDAQAGFTDSAGDNMFKLEVVIGNNTRKALPAEKLEALKEILSNNPRPHYHNDEERVYTMSFCNTEIKFRVRNQSIITD